MNNIANIRKEYIKQTLLETNAEQNAIAQFSKWWNEAQESQIDEINAMTLCTVKNNIPNGRIVLLKGFTEQGFSFFTNYNSTKGHELEQNSMATLVFYWKELERQIRITGSVLKLSEAESTEYYNSRPFGSRLGAWASNQSTVLASRKLLDDKLAELEKTFTEENIKKPPYWGGYIVIPQTIEFWQGRKSRLHDRLLYTKKNDAWTIERLAP
jgi:pyridoxamine 5'-phosphate oxidase